MSYQEDRNPFFDVKRESIQTESGIVLNQEALVNEETNDVLGIVSKGYELVSNQDVMDLFDEAIADLSVSKTIDHMDSTTKRWKRHIVFDADNLNFEITSSDVVGILLEVFNGYTGRTGFGYRLMGYRWLCENGMVMGKKELFHESYAHYVANPEKLRDSFEMKFGAFQKNALVWEKWSKTPFTQIDFKGFVDEHTKPENGKASKHEYITPKIGQTIVDSYQPLLERQGLPETKWGAFNVLTWLSTHETKARNGSNVFSARYNTIERLAGDFYNTEDNEFLSLGM